MSGADAERLRLRAAGKDPDAVRTVVRALWLAGGDTDSIARAIGTHRAGVAEKLRQLDDAELIAGLRTHLDALVAARAAGKKRGKGGQA